VNDNGGRTAGEGTNGAAELRISIIDDIVSSTNE